MSPTAHLQMFRDPFQAHGRVFSQPRRQTHLLFIAFARLAQRLLVPPQLAQFFRRPAQRRGLLRILTPPKKMAAGRCQNPQAGYAGLDCGLTGERQERKTAA